MKTEKENGNPEITIVIDHPEVIDGNLYTGEIITVQTGYVFIHNVKRGYETIGTNGDVFCPVPLDAHFEKGEIVQFSELNPDKERVGKFRAESISKINLDLKIDTPEERMVAIAKLSSTTSPYHRLKKMINADDINKAGENKPLAEFVQQIAWLLNSGNGYTPEHISRLAEEFVAKTFSMLAPLELKCSINGDVDLEAEAALIAETIQLYDDSDLRGQAESLKKEYEQFLAVRRAFTLMKENNLLNYWSVLDYKHLPELAFAFPVWYVNGKNPLANNMGEDDPMPGQEVKFFSDCVGSTEFAWFYQIYNRRTRPLSHFTGKDIMPPSIVKIMNQAKKEFDFVAIMTPYHDVASHEWSDPNWLRNIDPIMVGFIKDLPYMFILGRWSGTGIFPLLLDCIADTANHLKLNKHLLKNFRSNTYWYKGRSQGNLSSSDNNGLENYAGRLLSAYDKGLLFPFLRGELKDKPEYKFPV